MLKLSSQKRKFSNCIFLFTLKIVLLSFPFFFLFLAWKSFLYLFFFSLFYCCDRRFPFICSPFGSEEEKNTYKPQHIITLMWENKTVEERKEKKNIWLRLCILNSVEWDENWSKENKEDFPMGVDEQVNMFYTMNDNSNKKKTWLVFCTRHILDFQQCTHRDSYCFWTINFFCNVLFCLLDIWIFSVYYHMHS